MDTTCGAAPKSIAARRMSIFGVALASDDTVPSIVRECVAFMERANGLRTKGLYRVSGVKSRVEYICGEFENERVPDLADESTTNIASVLKLYIRQLPTPLLVTSLYADYIRLGKVSRAACGSTHGAELHGRPVLGARARRSMPRTHRANAQNQSDHPTILAPPLATNDMVRLDAALARSAQVRVGQPDDGAEHGPGARAHAHGERGEGQPAQAARRRAPPGEGDRAHHRGRLPHLRRARGGRVQPLREHARRELRPRPLDRQRCVTPSAVHLLADAERQSATPDLLKSHNNITNIALDEDGGSSLGNVVRFRRAVDTSSSENETCARSPGIVYERQSSVIPIMRPMTTAVDEDNSLIVKGDDSYV